MHVFRQHFTSPLRPPSSGTAGGGAEPPSWRDGWARPHRVLPRRHRGPVRRSEPARRQPNDRPGLRGAPVRPLHSARRRPRDPARRAPDARRPAVDIQFKGSRRTQFSRGGDGLAALGPMLREYVISEAMAALGIPTTRSLAVVTTGESVYRDGVKRGAILTRVAASHLRVGTFEYAAALQDGATLRAARRLRDCPPLPGAGQHPRQVPCVLSYNRRPPGGAHRSVATRRLHPRRHEHR